MKRKTKIVLSICAGAVLVAAVGAGWLWKTRGPLLKEVAVDLKAGAMARHAENPFERFLELRYGPMTNAVNRQRAFLGFFDQEHQEGMRSLVRYMSQEERQKNISDTAAWIARYRTTMTPAEKESLANWLLSDEGRVRLQKAASMYRGRDLAYRSATEPVIQELMTTLAGLQMSHP